MGTSTDRTHYRELVAQIAAKAKAVLPAAVNGRVESAVKLVLAGDVHFLEDGTVEVGSSDPTRYYRLVGTACTCTDFTQEKAPEGWCKHRIAASIQKRVQEMLYGAPTAGVVSGTLTPPLPEAPVSITLKATLHGHEVLVTLRGHDFASVKVQVEQASAWLQSQTPAQASRQGEGWCSIHAVQMQLNEKAGRTWYSHKTADGWCKGR